LNALLPDQTNVVALTRTCCVRRLSESEVDYWSPARTGNWIMDQATGGIYASRTITYLRDEKNPVLFVSMMRAMVGKGCFEAVEAGFVKALAEQLTARP